MNKITPEPTVPAGVSEMADEIAMLDRLVNYHCGDDCHEDWRGHSKQCAYPSWQNIKAALRTPPVLEAAKEALENLLLHFNDDGLHKMRVDLPFGHQAMSVTAARAFLQTIGAGQ